MSKKIKSSETPVAAEQAAAKPSKKAMVIHRTEKAPEWKGTQSGDAWLAAVQECEGKTVAEFTAHCLASPPRLTKKGKVDAPAGWLRFLVKNGYVTISEPTAPSA